MQFVFAVLLAAGLSPYQWQPAHVEALSASAMGRTLRINATVTLPTPCNEARIVLQGRQYAVEQRLKPHSDFCAQVITSKSVRYVEDMRVIPPAQIRVTTADGVKVVSVGIIY